MATLSTDPRTTTITLASVSSGPFDLSFRLFDSDGVTVYVNGTATNNFTLSADFRDGYDDNATITLNSSQPIGTIIVVDADLRPRREADYIDGPGLTAKLNIEFARIWSSIADTRRDSKRGIRVLGEISPIALTAAERANRAVIFSADGLKVLAGPTADEVAAAQTYAEEAMAARDKAEAWADEDEDVDVEPGRFSAKHHAAKAEDSSVAAQGALEGAIDARDAALASGNLYPDVATGLAATAEGDYFAVVGPDADTYATLYRKTDGAAVEVKAVASKALVDSKANDADLHPVAKSGDANDLDNLAAVALSGDANDLDNLARVALSGSTADLTQATDARLLTEEGFAKLQRITVTFPTDLDDIRTRVNSLTTVVQLRGNWNPTSGVFPGAGVAQAGWAYIVTATGTVDGVTFDPGDRIIALTDNASTTTYAGNWLKEDMSDAVSSVQGKTGAVTLDLSEIDETGVFKRYTLTEQNKVARLTVTFPTNLDTIRTKTNHLTVTAATNLDTIRTKVNHLTVTAATDLDAIRTRIAKLDAAYVLISLWNPTSGTFPGGGLAQKGDTYIVSGFAGTVDGVFFRPGDAIQAIVDNASTTTYADNWRRDKHAYEAVDLGLGNVDDTRDADKPLSGPQKAALDRRLADPGTLPSGPYADVPIAKGEDGRVYLMRHADGAVSVADMRVAASLELDAATRDGHRLREIDPQGFLGAALGPATTQTGYRTLEPPGYAATGLRGLPRRRGDWWQYECDGVTFDVLDLGDDYAAHLPATQMLRVKLDKGQSWQERLNETADIDYEDPSGRIRKAVEAQQGRIAIPRIDAGWAGAFPWTYADHPHRKARSTTDLAGGGEVTGFRTWAAKEAFRTGEFGAVAMNHFLAEFGAERCATLSAFEGRAGTAKRFFAPEGETWSWTGGSESAELLAGESVYMWAADIATRAEIVAAWRDDWGRDPAQVVWDIMTWNQGGADSTPELTDNGEYYSFLEMYHDAIKALNLRTSHGGHPFFLMWQPPSNCGENVAGFVAVDIARFARDRAAQNVFCIGPRYPYPMEDQIHQTARSAVYEGGMEGLASAYCLVFGKWTSLRIESCVLSGSNLVFTLSDPEACDDADPVFDTDWIEAAPGLGFSANDWSGDADNGALTLGTPSVTGRRQITVPITSSLTGVTDIRVKYGYDGTAGPNGTKETPGHSGTWGNLRRKGRHWLRSVGVRMDLWCEVYNEVIETGA